MNKVELGCGLIGIGRKWGVRETPVPNSEEVYNFLDTALSLGISTFDTAPAYALSEQRLGEWLSKLSESNRKKLTIATKCGEHWNFTEDKPYKDFSFDALRKSLDKSARLLGAINILQIHGVTPSVIASFAVPIQKIFDYARSLGIESVGMSISDPAAFQEILNNFEISVLQIQHNKLKPYPADDIKLAVQKGIHLLINRPFGMGQLAMNDEVEKIDAFRFILQTIPQGTVLTGTKSPWHLQENLQMFAEAKK